MLQVNKFNPRGDAIASGMGEFKLNLKTESNSETLNTGCISTVLNQVAACSAGVNVLVWKWDGSPGGKRGGSPEGEVSRATGSRGQRDSRPPRPSRDGRPAAGDTRLRKKRSSLEEGGTKTVAKTRSKSTLKAKALRGEKK